MSYGNAANYDQALWKITCQKLQRLLEEFEVYEYFSIGSLHRVTDLYQNRFLSEGDYVIIWEAEFVPCTPGPFFRLGLLGPDHIDWVFYNINEIECAIWPRHFERVQ